MELLFISNKILEIKKIEPMLAESKVLLDPCGKAPLDVCKIENYLFSNFKISCLLDRNIVSYLVDLVKGIELSANYNESKCHRIASALQAFLNAANIQSEPGLSYHEYMDNASLHVADEELSYFRAADNTDPNYYLDLALMKINKIPAKAIPQFNSGELIQKNKGHKIKAFEFNVVVIKKAICIRSKCSTDYEAIKNLLEWMFNEYVSCPHAFFFLAIYFSSKKNPGMLKSSSYKSVRNAAWDLALLQHWNSLQNRDPTQCWLLATMDKAIVQTVNLMQIKSSETKTEYLKRLENEFAKMWGKKSGYGKRLFKRFCYWSENTNCSSRKVNQPENQSSDYMLALRAIVDREYNQVTAGE